MTTFEFLKIANNFLSIDFKEEAADGPAMTVSHGNNWNVSSFYF